MKKMMLLLPLLFSVKAFCAGYLCDNGCTMEQIEANNKANYKTPEQLRREAEAEEAERERIWVEEHRADQGKL